MLKEYDKAEASIKNILKLKPDFLEARYQLAVFTMTRAIELRKPGKSETIVLEKLLEAESLCRELIEQDKNFVKAYYLLDDIHVALARLYINNGELDLAEKECSLALTDFEPDNPIAMVLLSTIYSLKKKYDEAFAEAEYVSKYSSKYVFKDGSFAQPAAVYFIKGIVWLHREKYDKAVSALKEVTLIRPDVADPHYFLAQGLVRLGQTQTALNEFRKVISLAPTFIPAKLRLAKLMSRIGGWQSNTVMLCEDILEMKPDHVEALELLGQSYMKERNFENAEIQFRKIIELSPSVGKINMAYLSLGSGQLSKCIRQCEEIINTNSNEIRAYKILGLAHIRRGNFDSGIEQFKKVLEINPRSTETLINIAKACVVTEKNDEAKDALKNVITIDPNNLQSRILLAGIYKKQGNIDEAAKLLEQVTGINAEYLEGYQLAAIYLLQGKTGASIDLCNKAIKLFPDNTTLYTNLAISHQQNKNYVASIKYSRKVVELNPENTFSRIVLVNNYTSNGEYRIANEQIESISSFTPGQKKAYHVLLDLCQLNNKKGEQITLALNRSIFASMVGLLDLAISECKKAVEIFPENVVAKVILANIYLSVNRNEDAIEIYSEIIKDKPEFASSYYDLGRAYLMADKEDEAFSIFQDLIGVDSKSVAGRLAVASILAKKGETKKAAKMVKDIIDIDSDNMMAHNLLGKVGLVEKDYEGAETEFSKMIELNRDSFEAHYYMARIKFNQGEFGTCIDHCRSALEIRPQEVRVHDILGRAFLRIGWVNKAALEFSRIIDINSEFISAYINLAKINIAVNKPDIAVLLYKAALKIDPDSVEARVGLGNYYTLMGNYSKAISEFEAVIKEYPEYINAYISLARTYLTSDYSLNAQEAIKTALSLEPDNPKARYVLAKIYLKIDEIRQAILQLKQVLAGNPKKLNLYELGVLYVDIEDYDNAILTYRQGVENFPENSLLWCNLALAYQMNKDYENAKDACDNATDFDPDKIIPNLCKVYIYMDNGNYENARLHLQEKININDVQKKMHFDLLELCNQNKETADRVIYHLARALTYTNYKWFSRVLRECEEITRIVPANAVAYNIQLEILISTKEFCNAIEVCKKILVLEPKNSAFYNKLAALYHHKGDIDEALTQYRNATSVAPDDVTANMGIGILLEIKGLFEESVNAYKKVIELDPTFPMAYNNLAWVYAIKMKIKMDEAMTLAEKAKELVPDSPDITDTLGWIYYMDAKYEKAVSLLKDAVQNAPWNPSMRYHLGMAYYKNGLPRETLAELQRALKFSNTFPEAGEAKEVIGKIMLSKVNDTSK